MSLSNLITTAAMQAGKSIVDALTSGTSNTKGSTADKNTTSFAAILNQQAKPQTSPSSAQSSRNSADANDRGTTKSAAPDHRAAANPSANTNASQATPNQTTTKTTAKAVNHANASDSSEKTDDSTQAKQDDEESDATPIATQPADAAIALAVALSAMTGASRQAQTAADETPVTPSDIEAATAAIDALTDQTTGTTITSASDEAPQAMPTHPLLDPTAVDTQTLPGKATAAALTTASGNATASPTAAATRQLTDTPLNSANTVDKGATHVTAEDKGPAVIPNIGLDEQAKRMADDTPHAPQASADVTMHAIANQSAAQAAQAATQTGVLTQAQAGRPAALTLTPRVGTQDWNHALSQQVVWLSSAHQQTAQLTLNPPDLGPLHVVLNVADNAAQALFVSSHAAVRDAVQAALPQLRDSLANNGITLGNANVSADTSQQQAFAQQQNSSGSANTNGSGSSANRTSLQGFGTNGDDTGAITTTVAVPVRSHVGLVDTFA